MNNHPHHRLKKWVILLAACGVAALGPLTLLPAVGWSWPVELLTHFQLQYFLAAIALAVMLAGLRRRRLCGGVGVVDRALHVRRGRCPRRGPGVHR